MAREPIKDDAEFARALERVGTTIESRIHWLLKLYDQRETIDHFTEEQMKALWHEIAVFVAPMLDAESESISWVSVREAAAWGTIGRSFTSGTLPLCECPIVPNAAYGWCARPLDGGRASTC